MSDADTPAWWRVHCNREIPPEHVTYDKRHDPAAGGCGMPVLPMPRKSAGEGGES